MSLEAVQPVVNLLREIGEHYSKSPSQVAIRWLIEKERILPISGAINSQQAVEDVGALSFSLSQEEIEALSQATQAWQK